MPQFSERAYNAVVGSDIRRDGMFLEISDAAGQPVAEVFYSDLTGEMTFTGYASDIPLAPLEWIVATARDRLPPAA